LPRTSQVQVVFEPCTVPGRPQAPPHRSMHGVQDILQFSGFAGDGPPTSYDWHPEAQVPTDTGGGLKKPVNRPGHYASWLLDGSVSAVDTVGKDTSQG